MASSSEPVTAPDQHKPTNLKPIRVAAVILILVLLSFLIGNHHGRVEDLWLIGTAATIAIGLVGDWILRRNGLI